MTDPQPTTLMKPERAELAQSAPGVIFAGAIHQLLRAAGDGTVEASKVREIYAIAKEMKADYARDVFKAALSRVQRDLPRITKEGRIEHLKQGFARYEDIDKIVRPMLAAEGFAVSFDTKPGQGNTLVYSCELSHAEGHSEFRFLPLPSDQSGGKNPIQAMGSAVSYAKRYLLGMHLNIITVGEDDDGNGGQLITAAQVDFLRKEMATFKPPKDAEDGPQRREGALLGYLKVKSYEQIPAAMFTRAVNWIESKRSGTK